MGLRFNADKLVVYEWTRDHIHTTITRQGRTLTILPSILIYLGHMLSHLGYAFMRHGTWSLHHYAMTYLPTKCSH